MRITEEADRMVGEISVKNFCYKYLRSTRFNFFLIFLLYCVTFSSIAKLHLPHVNVSRVNTASVGRKCLWFGKCLWHLVMNSFLLLSSDIILVAFILGIPSVKIFCRSSGIKSTFAVEASTFAHTAVSAVYNTQLEIWMWIISFGPFSSHLELRAMIQYLRLPVTSNGAHPWNRISKEL